MAGGSCAIAAATRSPPPPPVARSIAFSSSDCSRGGRLDDRRVVGQVRRGARGGERLAQAAEVIDEVPLDRLLPHPDAAPTDRVDLGLRHAAALAHAVEERVVKLVDLVRELALLVLA